MGQLSESYILAKLTSLGVLMLTKPYLILFLWLQTGSGCQTHLSMVYAPGRTLLYNWEAHRPIQAPGGWKAHSCTFQLNWSSLYGRRAHLPLSPACQGPLVRGEFTKAPADPLRSSAWVGELTMLSLSEVLRVGGGVAEAPTRQPRYCRWWKGLLMLLLLVAEVIWV